MGTTFNKLILCPLLRTRYCTHTDTHTLSLALPYTYTCINIPTNMYAHKLIYTNAHCLSLTTHA